MYTAKVNWTFGNFKISASAELDLTPPVGKLAERIVNAGLLQVLQRVPSSRAEKAVAGYDKRPAGFQRNSIAYSPDTALALQVAFGTEVDVEGETLRFRIDSVVEHVTTEEAKPSQEVKDMWAALKRDGLADAAAVKLKLAPGYTDDDAIKALHQVNLANKRAAAAEAARKTMEGLMAAANS